MYGTQNLRIMCSTVELLWNDSIVSVMKWLIQPRANSQRLSVMRTADPLRYILCLHVKDFCVNADTCASSINDIV